MLPCGDKLFVDPWKGAKLRLSRVSQEVSAHELQGMLTSCRMARVSLWCCRRMSCLR